MIYYLHHEGVQEAYELIKDVEPSTPAEYILKGPLPPLSYLSTQHSHLAILSGVVNASVGQVMGSREHIKLAQQLFQVPQCLDDIAWVWGVGCITGSPLIYHSFIHMCVCVCPPACGCQRE